MFGWRMEIGANGQMEEAEMVRQGRELSDRKGKNMVRQKGT